jgi:LmbE family N-acetylglucosaminyl deacetylase
MNFRNPTASIFIQDGKPEPEALARITHLGIGAHQDDLEFMAFHGITECFYRTDRFFGGITCTNGVGSAHIGPYSGYSDEAMRTVRRDEQNKAATVGRYGAMIQLDYSPGRVRDPQDTALTDDLAAILDVCCPEVVYTHNPADKHDTHVAVLISVIRAIRRLPKNRRPVRVLGCEVWRGLDWMPDAEKFVMDVTGHDSLAAALNGIFDSQIAGGKRYDLATLGRRRANATFFEWHATDKAEQILFAMDLSPLAADESLDLAAHTGAVIGRFRDEVLTRLAKFTGN